MDQKDIRSDHVLIMYNKYIDPSENDQGTVTDFDVRARSGVLLAYNSQEKGAFQNAQNYLD